MTSQAPKTTVRGTKRKAEKDAKETPSSDKKRKLEESKPKRLSKKNEFACMRQEGPVPTEEALDDFFKHANIAALRRWFLSAITPCASSWIAQASCSNALGQILTSFSSINVRSMIALSRTEMRIIYNRFLLKDDTVNKYHGAQMAAILAMTKTSAKRGKGSSAAAAANKEAAPVEEANKEAAPVEEANKEAASVEEANKEAASVEEASKESTLAKESGGPTACEATAALFSAVLQALQSASTAGLPAVSVASELKIVPLADADSYDVVPADFGPVYLAETKATKVPEKLQNVTATKKLLFEYGASKRTVAILCQGPSGQPEYRLPSHVTAFRVDNDLLQQIVVAVERDVKKAKSSKVVE